MHRPFILVDPGSHSKLSTVSAAITDAIGKLIDMLEQH